MRRRVRWTTAKSPSRDDGNCDDNFAGLSVTRPAQRVQSLKLGAAAQTLPVVVGYGTTLLATPYVVSRLGLHDFGVWAITGAIAQYAALLDMGISRASNRYVALYHAQRDDRSERAVVGICISALACLGALLAGFALLSPGLMDRVLGTGDPSLVRFLLLSAVSILVVGLLAKVLAAASIGRGRSVPAGIGLAFLSTSQAIGGVVALVLNPSLRAFAAGTVAGSALGLGVIVAIILFDERRIIIGLPRADIAREIIAYGLKIQVAATGDILLLQSGKLIAGVMIGPSAAGAYELASRLVMGAQVLGAASASALTPHLTRAYIATGADGLVNQYQRLTQRNTAVAILVPFGLAATAVVAIPLWLDIGNMQVVWVLLALLPGIAINVSTGVCTSTLLAMGRPALIAHATTVGGVVQVGLAIALGHAFGFAGIAVAFAVGVPTAKLLGLWYMQARAALPMKLYFRGIRGPFFIAAVATSAVLPIGVFIRPESREAALLPFIISAALFAAIYVSLGRRRNYLPQIPWPNTLSRVASRNKRPGP